MPADYASHAAARKDEHGPPRKVTTLKLRDEWVRLAAVQKLSPILRVVGMRLAHFYGRTGQLNPSYATLAKECDTTERTAQKAVAEFRKLGMIAGTRVPGGHHDATFDFTLIIPYRRVSKRTPVTSKSRVSERTPVRTQTGVRAGSRRVSRSVADGCPPVHPNKCQENSSVRNSERGSAARSIDADRESATTNSATVDDAPPNQRAPGGALIDTVETQQQPPSHASENIGTAATGADADPAFAAVYRRGRKVLGAGADAVTARLLAAYEGDVVSALDTLAAAEDESGPSRRRYVERDIEAANRARRTSRQ